MNTVERLILAIDATGMKTGADVAVDATKRVKRGAEEAERAITFKQRATELLGKTVAGLQGHLLGAGAALYGFSKIQQTLNDNDALSKLSQKAGVSTPILSALRHQAELAGLSFGDLSTGVKLFGDAIDKAQRGEAEQVRLFAELGIGVNAYKGDQNEIAKLIAATAERFSEMEDGVRKAAVAGDLFGRSGLNWIPLLNGGVAGMKAAREELERMGGVVSSLDGKKAEDLNDEFSRLGQTARATFTAIGGTDLLRRSLENIRFVGGGINRGIRATGDILSGVTPSEAAARDNADFGSVDAALVASRTAAVVRSKEDEKRAAEAVAKAIEAETDARERLRKSGEDQQAARDRDTASIEDFVAGLRLENELLGADELTRRKRLAVVNLENIAIDSVTGAYRVNAETLRRAREEAEALVEQNYESEQSTARHEEQITSATTAFVEGALAMGVLNDEMARGAATAGLSADEIADYDLRQRALNAAFEAGVDDAEAYADAIVNQARAVREAIAEQDKLDDLLKFFADLQDDATQAARRAKESIDDLTQATRDELAVVGKSNAERERAAALRGFDAAAAGGEAEQVRNAREQYAALFNELQRAKAADAAKTRIAALEQEVDLIGKTAEEQRRVRELADFDAQFEGLENVVSAERLRLEALQAQREELEQIEGLSYSAAEALASGASRALTDWSNVGDALASVSNRLAEIGLQTFFETPLKNALGSGLFGLLANANGNVFGPSGVQAFGNGDIVSEPTLFNYAGGKTGVMGESGKEAIMPVSRGANGRLGVEVSGSGGGVTIYQTVNISGGGDVYGGVHRSTRQAIDAARAAVEVG